MIKDVIIEIKTEQTLDASTDKIEFTTAARYGFRDGSYFISYDESRLMEVEGEIKTTLYVKPNTSVVLQRKGAYNSRMVIEKGVRNNCLYATPNGEFSLGIFGEKVLANLSDDGGNITMNYTIDSGLQLLSRNKVNISIREVN